jgi:hypothetical protein
VGENQETIHIQEIMKSLQQLKTDLEIYQEGVAEAPNAQVRDHYTKLCHETYQKIEEWEEPVTKLKNLWVGHQFRLPLDTPLTVKDSVTGKTYRLKLKSSSGLGSGGPDEGIFEVVEQVTSPNYRPVIGSLLKKLQDFGFTLVSVEDGGERHQLTGTNRDQRQQAKAAICAVDESHLYVDTSEGARKWLFIVLGNEPEETVNDHSGSGLDDVLEEFQQQWKGKSCPTK